MRIWTATRATRAIRRYYNQQPRYVHFSWITMDLLSISSVVWIHLLSLVDPPHRLGMLHPTGATCARSGEENVPWTRAGPAGARHGMACGKLPNGFQVTSELGWIVSYSKIPNLQIWGIFFRDQLKTDLFGCLVSKRLAMIPGARWTSPRKRRPRRLMRCGSW
jgi:hypothetical protein